MKTTCLLKRGQYLYALLFQVYRDNKLNFLSAGVCVYEIIIIINTIIIIIIIS